MVPARLLPQFGTTARDMFEIRHAQFPQDERAVLSIWREFVASPSVSLDFQGYEEEFANLPGKYGAPGGCLLLAFMDRTLVGCVGFRNVDRAICEMKRLYVRPAARGHWSQWRSRPGVHG